MGRFKRGLLPLCHCPTPTCISSKAISEKRKCSYCRRTNFSVRRLACWKRSLRNNCSCCSGKNSCVKLFKKVKKMNLKRMEPKGDDGGELEDTKDEEGHDTEAPASKFAGNKGGSNNTMGASSFELLVEGDDEDNEDSEISNRALIVKNQDNKVAGFAPCEKQITELRKVGKDKGALQTYKRGEKHEEMAFVLQKKRAAGGGDKKK